MLHSTKPYTDIIWVEYLLVITNNEIRKLPAVFVGD